MSDGTPPHFHQTKEGLQVPIQSLGHPNRPPLLTVIIVEGKNSCFSCGLLKHPAETGFVISSGKGHGTQGGV